MNRIAQARSELATALQPALPGRVYPYRPDRLATSTAPAIWIDDHGGQWRSVGRDGVQVFAVVFPVTILCDGADRAAQASYDELLAAAFDCAEAGGCEVDGWGAAAWAIDADTVLRGAVMSVAVLIHAATLCAPDPTTAQVPPIPLEV